MSENEEQLLVEQAKKDPQAFDQLYNIYVNRIYAYIWQRTHDESIAKDITAATFEKALRNIKRYEWRGFTFGAWLYRIAYNELVSYQRRQKFLSPLSTIERWWKSDTSVEAEVHLQGQKDVLHEALSQLADKDQELLVLKFYEGLSSREVGEIMGYSENNVNVRLHRALKRLKDEMSRLEMAKGAEYVSR